MQAGRVEILRGTRPVHIGPGKVELAPAAAPPVSMEAPDAKDPSRRTTGLTVPADQVFFSEGVRIALPSGVLDAGKKKVTRPWSRTTFMLFYAAMAATAVDDSPTPFSRDAMMRFKSAVLGPLVGLVLFALAAPSLDAQSVWGIRGGVSVASASFRTDTFDADNRTGFTGGLFWDHGGKNLFGYQFGASYTQKGFEGSGTSDDVSLNYIEIPAILKLGIPLGFVKPSVFGGAALGINVGCSYDGPSAGFVDPCDDISGTEWSGVFGFDTAFYLSSISLWFDARYHVGINNILDSDNFDDLKNRAWNITGGVGFPLGG